MIFKVSFFVVYYFAYMPAEAVYAISTKGVEWVLRSVSSSSSLNCWGSLWGPHLRLCTGSSVQFVQQWPFSAWSPYIYLNPHPRIYLERERERERNIDWLPSVYAPTGDQICDVGVCPDWGLNLQPLDVRDYTPTN